MSVTDAAVIKAHSDLPALRVLLDPERLAEATADLGCGNLRLDRLRLKPRASVTAMLRPVSGSGQWVLARGFTAEPWATKRGKDLLAAEEAGLPAWELPAARLVLASAASDRRLRGLAALRPDIGSPVPTADHVVVRTLSHNPARRWVGLAESEVERRVLRLHSHRRAESLPWAPGRRWQPGDVLPAPLMHVLDGRNSFTPNLPRLLAGAVTGLRMLHGPWADRAAACVSASADRLGAVSRVPAHGDLTPDQVVVDGDCATVLDWDCAGNWPEGWDAATWTAGLIVAGWHPGDGTCAVEGVKVPPAVLVAAAILRGPEPFRRRHPDWPERIEALLAHAEQAVS
ncbi:hypothetical protein [Granulicoccus sp. GXG6511]|uniref:hypothetical protein n=1 Tax=Granulicoccus sp. GXG6511 TaxID=3381351 RepID=UPI003D7C65D1